MQLKLLRDQNESTTGILANKTEVSFVLNAKLLFDEEEAAAINKYGIGGEILHYDEGNPAMTITLGNLSVANGKTFVCKSVGEVMDIEDIVRKSCANAKGYIAAAKAFGGEEIIDI